MTTLQGRLTAGPIREAPLYYTSGRVARRYAKTVRTLDRWLDGGLFPPPDLTIHKRRYWTAETLDRFDAQQKAATRYGNAEGRASKVASPPPQVATAGAAS
jgi:MerR-like DNA binding protein